MGSIMRGARLHEFWVKLSRYTCWNVALFGVDGAPIERDHAWCKRLDRGLSPGLARHLRAWLEGPGDRVPTLLLAGPDLAELAAFADSLWGLEDWWTPYPKIHARSVLCLREIRAGLSRHHAEAWAERSADLGRRLEQEGLRIVDGIGLIGEWVEELHLLLEALGATDLLPPPAGSFPTPTCPSPPVAVAERLASPRDRIPVRTDPLSRPGVQPPELHGLGDALGRIATGLEPLSRIAAALDPTPPEFVGTRYIADRLGQTTVWIAEMARRGDIPKSCVVEGTGTGKVWKFHRDKIDEWLKTR